MRLAVSIFGFLQLSLVDLLDILMVALIIYFLIRLIRNSSAMNIFLALIFLLVVQVVVTALGMKMMSVIMNTLLDVGVLAIIVIFQPEIRHLLNRIGSRTGITRRTGDVFNRILGIKEEPMGNAAVQEITEACRTMAGQKTGALIVIPHRNPLTDIIEKLGTNVFCRLRFGLGDDFPRGRQIDFVLGQWKPSEEPIVDQKVDEAVEIIKSFVIQGPDRTMNQFNKK